MSTRTAVRLGTIVWGCAVLAVVLSGCKPAITVLSTIPASGATNVPFGTQVSATFSAAVDPASITDATFTLKKGGTAIPGTVSYDAATNTATLVPTAALAPLTVYTATINAEAEKQAAKCLECYGPFIVVPAVIAIVPIFIPEEPPIEYSWTFTTAPIPTHPVTYVAVPDGGGTVSGPPTISEGGTIPVTVTPSPGWSLESVTTSNGSIGVAVKTAGSYTLSGVTAAATVTAVFVPDVFTLTYVAIPENAGTVTGPPTIITGGSATVNVTATTGWELESLTTTSGTLSGTGPYTLSGVTANATITATFTQLPFPVTYVADPPEGGTVTGPATIAADGSIEAAVTINPDWDLISVTTSNGVITTSAPYILSDVTGPATVTATFLEVPRK